jgi:hypothetical protein
MVQLTNRCIFLRNADSSTWNEHDIHVDHRGHILIGGNSGQRHVAKVHQWGRAFGVNQTAWPERLERGYAGPDTPCGGVRVPRHERGRRCRRMQNPVFRVKAWIVNNFWHSKHNYRPHIRPVINIISYNYSFLCTLCPDPTAVNLKMVWSPWHPPPSNVEWMHSVCFKKDFAKRRHPSSRNLRYSAERNSGVKAWIVNKYCQNQIRWWWSFMSRPWHMEYKYALYHLL